jgi:ubiquinone/menaquinone biosynthesis C-methylase UbiE
MKSQSIYWNNYYKNHRWNKETSSLPRTLYKKDVLEIGVGTGKTLISILKQNPKSITAIDFSRLSIEKCRIKFKEDKIKFINSNIKKLNLPSNKFDIVICYYTLNNLEEKERKYAIKEIHRVLKDNGFIIFEDFHNGDFRHLSQAPHKEANSYVKKNGIFCHYFTKDEIKQLFSQFKIEKLKLKISKPIKNKEHSRKIISFIGHKISLY